MQQCEWSVLVGCSTMGNGQSSSCDKQASRQKQTDRKTSDQTVQTQRRLSGSLPNLAVERKRSSNSETVLHCQLDQFQLTDSQKSLIRRSWSHTSKHNIENIGVRIYLKIFQRCPTVKQIFHFDNIPDQQLSANCNFQRLAKVCWQDFRAADV